MKKAIAPVIAVSLLMVVAVVSVVSLQGWFETYSSNIENKIDSASKESISISLNYLERNSNNLSLYYYNPSIEYIEVTTIKVDSIACPLVNSDVLAQESITKVDVTNCTTTLNTKSEIVLITPRGVFSEQYYVK